MHLRHNHSEPDENAAATMSWRRRTALVLAVALPIPVFAASGLALPMPSALERLVRSLVTGTEAPVHDFADGEGAVVDAYGGGGPRSPRTREREAALPVVRTPRSSAQGKPEDARRPARRVKRPPRVELPAASDAVGAVLATIPGLAEPSLPAVAVSDAAAEPARPTAGAEPSRDEAAAAPPADPAPSEKPVEAPPTEVIVDTVKPPAVKPPAVEPPAVDLPVAEPPTVQPPAVEPPLGPLPPPVADPAVEHATSALLDAPGGLKPRP
jgi:hypothetical protein